MMRTSYTNRYSHLYTNTSRLYSIPESGSSDSDSQLVSPSQRTRAGDEANGIYMTVSQASLMVIIAGLASVGVVLLLICQVGLLGRDQQVMKNHSFNSSGRKPFSRRSSIQYVNERPSYGMDPYQFDLS